MSRESYQAELRRVMNRPKFVTSRSNVGDGAQIDAVPIPPSADPSKYLLGVLLDMSVKVTNTSSSQFLLTTAKGGSPLDFFIQRIRVKADEGSSVRSTAIDRWSAEGFEQISLNLNKASYPRAIKAIATTQTGLPTTTTIAKSTKSGFIQQLLFVPVGGRSCALEIDVPSLPTIGSGATNRAVSLSGTISTASRIFNYNAIYGHDPTVVSFDSRITQNLGVNADNSLLEYQVKNMSPDYVGYVNKLDVNKVIIEGENEVLANFIARDFPFIQQAVPDLAPTYSNTGASVYATKTDLIWFGLNKKRMATHVASVNNTTDTVNLELLSISWDEGPGGVTPPEPQPSGTPDPKASKIVPGPTANSSTPTGRQGTIFKRA